jgi:hypothetical protein
MENINYVHNIIAPKFYGYIMPIFFMILLMFLVLSCIGIIYYMKNTTIIITDKSLTIKTLFYGKTIPLDRINAAGVRNFNLLEDREYNIKIRINGIRLSNYSAGWMRLNNGNKALVYLTDKTNVALFPTDEYDILFSTDDFDRIKEILNKKN